MPKLETLKTSKRVLLIINRLMNTENPTIDFSQENLNSDFREMDEAGMLSQLILNESAFNNKLIVDVNDIDFDFTPHTIQLLEEYHYNHHLMTKENISLKGLLVRLVEENRIRELFISK